MSNTSVKVAIALFMVLAIPAASFARGGGGGAPGGGSAATGNLAGGRANAGALNSALSNTDPSGVGNAGRVAAPPPPRISAPTVPQFK
jgi:hypothetical protein